MPATVTLEHYEVLTRNDGSLHELGRGAMGITYKGFDTRLRVPVALKVINAAHLHSERARQRFVREARSAAQLRHRNVASVFHLGEDGGNYFYAMEFIDGETVEALVRRQGPLAPAFALRIAAQVARALNAAQAHDLVHRDIKPTNLMAVVEDDDLVIKVIDFGLAKVMLGSGEGTAQSLTHGGILGTPHFASPEQLEEREIDVRSDIYSLGVTLWYLLTGATPFAGSVARVVGQHLTKQPPFDDLTTIPDSVVGLLRRMLAKSPAERPQSPAALRREIEDCLKGLAEPDQPTPGKSIHPTHATAPFSTPPSSEDLPFETGLTIAHRYLITEQLEESEAGLSFLARDLQRKREARLLLLHRELLADVDIMGRITLEAEDVSTLTHPNLLEVSGPIHAGRNAFFALEATDGFSLRQMLRARRELLPEEVHVLLEPVAAGLDDALRQLPRLELGLHHVLLHFPNRVVPVEELLQRRVPAWPAFAVKLNPLATWRELFALTWTAGQTLVGGGVAAHHTHAEGRATALQALGGIAYELLGGVAAGYGTLGYSPLAALDEAGNAVLRRALLSPESFASAAEFVQQFAAPAAFEAIPSTPPRPAPPAVERISIREEIPPPKLPAAALPEMPTLELPPPAGLSRILLPVAAALVVAASTYAFIHFRERTPAPSWADVTPAPATPIPAPATPVPTTPLIATHRATPIPTTPAPSTPRPSTPPRPATPSPSTPPPPSPSTPPPTTPPPPPSRLDLASEARKTAEAFEVREKYREALGSWLKMAKDFPEFDTGRLGIEMLLTRLRRRPGGLTPTEFTAMRADLRQAAQRGVLAAMLTLGDELRSSDPKEAFAWYCAAANGGEPLAMTQAGLMLTNGLGTPRDMAKAVAYFRASAEKGEPTGMTALAECYLDGDGVPKDLERGLSLLQKASEKGNSYAKNRLGWCYHQGIGVKANPREAFRLFTAAADGGSVEALANLGILYLKGEGVEKNPSKAFEKFKEASAKGNVNGMYFYAGCFIDGVGVKPDEETAKKWFQKAAAAGHANAIEWCQAHAVEYKPRP